MNELVVDLPAHLANGFLPPHVGDRFVVRDGASPYRIAPITLVERFATSPERITLLAGLFRMRKDARALGLETGFQWIGGSFVDAVPAPKDLDVATFYVPPASFAGTAGATIVSAHPELFEPTKARENYGCDAYFLGLRSHRKSYRQVAMWYALFAHDRATLTWKGFIELGLPDAGEDVALAALDALLART